MAVSTLLQKAFNEAAKLPVEEQEVLASRLLIELAKEDDFDRKIASTTDRLAELAAEALEENKAGLTQALDQFN
jgi:hypothetical protein